MMENLDKKDINKFIITNGSKGAFYFSNNKLINIPGFKVKAVDSTGAGDTFTGALATTLISCESISDCIKFANKCASISTLEYGAQSSMPMLDQIKKV